MLSKRTYLGPAILLAALIIGYPLYWLYVATFAEELVHDWVEEHRLNGFAVSHGRVETSGFPFVVRVKVPAPDASNQTTGVSWRSETLNLELQPWDLRRFRLDAFGAQQVQFNSQADSRDYTANTTGIEGVALVGDSGSLAALSLVLKDVRLTEAEHGNLLKTDRILMDMKRPDQPPIAHTETALEFSIAAEQIALAHIEAATLGNTIGSLKIKSEFRGPLSGESLHQVITDWRTSGGTLEVHWLNLVWGALDLRANGTVALDTQMRPLGALTADFRGYEETLEALAEANLLRRDILPASRVTLNLLAKTSPADGRRVLTVPVTAQDGALFLGPIKLADLPALIMPDRRRPSAQPG